MNTWQIIKDSFLLECHNKQGSVGWLNTIHKAAELFMDLYKNDLLKDRKESEEAFNQDSDVTESILNGNLLEDLRKI